MNILGTIGYSQTYYFNAQTNRVTTKDGRNKSITDCLNGKSGDSLNEYDRKEMSAIETFLKMKGSGENYEFTYTRDGDNSFIKIHDKVQYEEKFTLLGKRNIDGKEGPMPSGNDGPPYSKLADENGIIEYNGVIFQCDYKNNWLCLGDMSNMDNVIRIPLSEGGCLMVNRANIDGLSKAISMFSPEDVNLILRALKLDAKIQEMKKEAEDMEDGIGKTNSRLHQRSGIN